MNFRVNFETCSSKLYSGLVVILLSYASKKDFEVRPSLYSLFIRVEYKFWIYYLKDFIFLPHAFYL